MAETIKQGVNYELTATDRTAEGSASAVKTVEGAAGKIRADVNGTANAFKGAFNPLSAVTAALTGNFQALGTQLLGLITRLKGVQMSMGAFALASAAVLAVVTAVKTLCKVFADAKERADKITFDNAAASLKSITAEAEAFNRASEAAKAATESTVKAIRDELGAIQALVKAENEFAKAQELALARSDEERAKIEEKYRAIEAYNGREAAQKSREAERLAATEKVRRLEEEIADLQDTEKDLEFSRAKAQREAQKFAKEGTSGVWTHVKGWARNIPLFGSGGEDGNLAKAKEWSDQAAAANASWMSTKEKENAKARELEEARHQLELLDVKEETSLYEEAATVQTLMNEANARADQERIRAEEELKAKAVAEAETVKETRLKAEAEVKRVRQANLAELTQSEQAAQTRLAAAKSAVQTAWGFYRDKDSMRRQLEEEKANAEAEKQFEKDFDKLSFRRDWRTAKNLSVDQEAVRRVALAKEEESAAEKAVVEIEKKVGEAVEELRKITEDS